MTAVKPSNSSGISVSWEPPPSHMQNGVIQEYRVNNGARATPDLPVLYYVSLSLF